MITEGRAVTTRASRYLVQLCRHAEHMNRLPHGAGRVRAEWTEDAGTVDITPWGRCTLRATPGALEVRIEAESADGMRRIRKQVTRNLTRFGRRDGLVLEWHPAAPRRTGRLVFLTAGVAALGVALHAGGLAALSLWTAGGAVVAAVAVALGHALIPAAVLRHRRRR